MAQQCCVCWCGGLSSRWIETDNRTRRANKKELMELVNISRSRKGLVL